MSFYVLKNINKTQVAMQLELLASIYHKLLSMDGRMERSMGQADHHIP